MQPAAHPLPGLTGVVVVVVFFVFALLVIMPGCGVKVEQLPFINFPYVAGFQFYQDVENIDGSLEKKKFKDDRVQSPFFFLLEIRDIENSGECSVSFYDKDGKRVSHKVFRFGEDGQYYEYILFFDRVAGLGPGTYRYTIFLRDVLIYEHRMDVSPPPATG